MILLILRCCAVWYRQNSSRSTVCEAPATRPQRVNHPRQGRIIQWLQQSQKALTRHLSPLHRRNFPSSQTGHLCAVWRMPWHLFPALPTGQDSRRRFDELLARTLKVIAASNVSRKQGSRVAGAANNPPSFSRRLLITKTRGVGAQWVQACLLVHLSAPSPDPRLEVVSLLCHRGPPLLYGWLDLWQSSVASLLISMQFN